MPQGFAVEEATTIEVVAAWTVPKTVVSCVAASPGWEVLGQYRLPKSCVARLEVIHLTTHEDLTSRVRLWDSTAGEPVSGAVSTSSTEPTHSLGGKVQLIGGHSYQVQAECTGSPAASDKFSVVESATITD